MDFIYDFKHIFGVFWVTRTLVSEYKTFFVFCRFAVVSFPQKCKKLKATDDEPVNKKNSPTLTDRRERLNKHFHLYKNSLVFTSKPTLIIKRKICYNTNCSSTTNKPMKWKIKLRKLFQHALFLKSDFISFAF